MSSRPISRFITGSTCALALLSAGGFAAPLFQEPLHLTREIADPVTGSTSVVEEYLEGDRVVSISGERTSIADYAKQELTVIDRARGTYSVTRFDELARVAPVRASLSTEAAKDEWTLRRGPETIRAGRSAEVFEATRGGEPSREQVRIALDRTITVSREAWDVLTGAAFPSQPDSSAETLRRAGTGVRREESLVIGDAGPRYALPLEHVKSFEIDGEHLEIRLTVTRVGRETAPSALLEIPRGATRVESPILERERLLRELDTLPGASSEEARP